ncbi:glycoside hydrolase family 72 protein [Delphinella strobiligena]|nr:glycoside hydrolase family 72 protein [Delphinella strobiligena]
MRSNIALGVAALAASATAIPTISAYGSKFFTSEGNQFFIKGVAYQLTPDDPLTDPTQCALDCALMKTLGANTIRVYHVDPTGNHTECMSTFADAGIYLFVDLDTFTSAINADDPAWTESQYTAFQAVMDEFQQFDNTAGFFVGNEVLTTGNNSIAAPYVKAAARDMKAYRNSKKYREIPVGYSAADISSLRPNLQNYLACGRNASEALDFFSLNAYEWCGDSSYTTSGYSQLNENVTDYNIPIFFSETGCNTPEPRTFADQAAIFGSDMSPSWSGAIIYEWIEESNDYGLISYGPAVSATATASGVYDGYTRTGTPTPISPDFFNLSTQWASLTPTGVSSSAYTTSNTAPSCPAFTSSLWEVNGDVALPTLGQTYDAAVSSSITAGTASTASASATSTGTGTKSGTAASASSTKTGMASPGKEIAGMSAGLVAVMLGFVWWL